MVKLTIQDTTLTIQHCTVNVTGGHKTISSQVLHGGVIKEHISRNDYKITITGTIVADPERVNLDDFTMFKSLDTSDFPEKKVVTQQLVDFLQYQGSISIEHRSVLDKLGVQTVVIDSYTLPYTTGENNQDITINCTSDYVIWSESDFKSETVTPTVTSLNTPYDVRTV